MRFIYAHSLAVAVACAALASPASAGMYTFTTVSEPGSTVPPGAGTTLLGINNSGTIVGSTLIQVPSPVGPPLIGINNSFVLSGGVFNTINFPGVQPGISGAVQVQNINNLGQYVGLYVDTSATAHGFIVTGANVQTIDAPGAVNGTQINAINASGQMVLPGFGISNTTHSFLLSNGTFTPIVDPNGVATFVSAINDAGDIAGSFIDAGGNEHGFLLHNGQFMTLDDPQAGPNGFTFVANMSNTGEIVGT
jgi:hypothetical protein